jgi:penicillin amidase
MRSFTIRSLLVLFAAASFASLAFQCERFAVIPGLQETVKVSYDPDGVPHFLAENDLDAARAQGYVHARDRFFQMDATRREVSGDLAELLGPGRLGGDIQNRTIGLRRAAERSLAALAPEGVALLEAYAEGVNAWLAENPLPPEYAALELTEARPWNVVDSLAIGKAISASLSLDIDVGLTLALQDYVEAGITHGFDGQAFFREDVYRAAPMDPASTVPDATGGVPYLARKAPEVDPAKLALAAAAARRLEAKWSAVPNLQRALHPRESFVGSNEWGVAGSLTDNGQPMIANDPHLSLNAPSTFYELHIQVTDDPLAGPMNVSGVGFPGTPGVILGQTERVTWGATTNPMDVTDTFLDEFHVFTPECTALGALACLKSEGVLHPAEVEIASYRYNSVGDGIQDNLVDPGLPLEQTLIVTVPFRSFGPVVDITDPSVIGGGGVTTALVVQYTGFHATGELETFRIWNRAENLADFLDGLTRFDVGSQNWAYADVDGNLGYFASAENPLRRDLEDGAPYDGLGPMFIRDGSGPANWVPDPAHSQGQAIPYAVLPADEMPQTLNPPNGFFVNANNDPAGTSLDNDPINQYRPSKPTAIYYLNPGYAIGMRAGRITRLIEEIIDRGKPMDTRAMEAIQANTQQLDAELMTPFLLQAFENASEPGAPPALAALAADAGVAEAVSRLAAWNFSAPTGIPEGWDAHDKRGERVPYSPPKEASRSVAATLYNLWRGKAIRQVVDARLADFGLSAGSSEALKALHHFLSQSPYTGVAAAGVDWIPEPAALSAAQRRDLALLQAMRSALDALASDEFAPAFGNSTDQDDYRWGKLHRIVFDHAFNPDWSIPPQAGFDHLSPPALRGLPRDGGYNVVNASGFSARATGLNSFMFGGGPVRRYIGQPDPAALPGPAIRGQNSLPGGPSGVPGSPDYATQLAVWLTADYHDVGMERRDRSSNTEYLVPRRD